MYYITRNYNVILYHTGVYLKQVAKAVVARGRSGRGVDLVLTRRPKSAESLRRPPTGTRHHHPPRMLRVATNRDS